MIAVWKIKWLLSETMKMGQLCSGVRQEVSDLIKAELEWLITRRNSVKSICIQYSSLSRTKKGINIFQQPNSS